jgi:hypothetical protein
MSRATMGLSYRRCAIRRMRAHNDATTHAFLMGRVYHPPADIMTMRFPLVPVDAHEGTKRREGEGGGEGGGVGGGVAEAPESAWREANLFILSSMGGYETGETKLGVEGTDGWSEFGECSIARGVWCGLRNWSSAHINAMLAMTDSGELDLIMEQKPDRARSVFILTREGVQTRIRPGTKIQVVTPMRLQVYRATNPWQELNTTVGKQ